MIKLLADFHFSPSQDYMQPYSDMDVSLFQFEGILDDICKTLHQS